MKKKKTERRKERRKEGNRDRERERKDSKKERTKLIFSRFAYLTLKKINATLGVAFTIE